MHFIWMLIVGLVVGALAKLIVPGRDPGGIFVTMLIGIAGSFIAGMIGRALGWYAPGHTAVTSPQRRPEFADIDAVN